MTDADDDMIWSHVTSTFDQSTNYGSQIGIAQNSTINNTYNNAVTAHLETPSPPTSHVPFPRDPHFVDRGTLLDQVHEKCVVNTSWTALVGLGGVG